MPSPFRVVRLAIKIAEWGAPVEGWDISDLLDEEVTIVEWDAPFELRKLAIEFARAPAGSVVEDIDVVTMHFLRISGGSPSSAWVDADFTAVESALDTWWTAVKPYYASITSLSRYVWHKDGPDFHPASPTVPNASVRAVTKGVAGTATAGNQVLPPQVAITVTRKTQNRKRWGRFYMPNPIYTVATTDGRITTAFADALAGAADTAFTACRAANVYPVVWSPSTESAFSVDAIQVDNIFDVVRSRRYQNPTYRKLLSVLD